MNMNMNNFCQDIMNCKKKGMTLYETIKYMDGHPNEPKSKSFAKSVIITTFNR